MWKRLSDDYSPSNHPSHIACATVLLGQAQAFSELQAGDSRIIKSIKNIVSTITSLSAAPTLGYAVGFVRHKTFKLMVYSTALTAFTVIPICNTRCSRYPT